MLSDQSDNLRSTIHEIKYHHNRFNSVLFKFKCKEKFQSNFGLLYCRLPEIDAEFEHLEIDHANFINLLDNTHYYETRFYHQ